MLGPLAITNLRQHSMLTAVSDLASKIDNKAFEHAFGASKEHLKELVDAKTVTISHLMELAPEGTIDPTPFLYNSTMYAMAGTLGIGMAANSLVRPVSEKYWLMDEAAHPEDRIIIDIDDSTNKNSPNTK